MISLEVGPSPARCGAFLEAPGQGEVISSLGFSTSTRAFDANGRLVPIPDYQKFELGSYIEYGASDRVTLIAQPGIDDVHQAGGQSLVPIAASTDLGARVGLFRFDSTIISLQALGHLPFASTSMQAGFFDQDRAPGADLRLLLGREFAINRLPGFLDIELSHTWEGDALPQMWHADVTLGLRPQPRLLLMLASYTTVAADSWSWIKVQPAIVYELARQWAIEGGGFITVAGQKAGRELGPMVALWYHF